MSDLTSTGFRLGNISILPRTICIFGVISNVLLIIAFIKDPLKCFRNPGTYLVINMAISDLLTSFLANFSTSVLQTSNWILQFVWITMTIVSILTLGSIAVDRFLMVVYPMKHRVFMKGKIIIVWSACIWLVALALPLRVSIPAIRSADQMEAINFFGAAVIIFTGVMYGMTYHKLKKQSKNLALENLSNRQQQARAIKEKRFLKTIILVACIALACLAPALIFYHLTVLQDSPIDGVAFRILTGIFAGIYYINFAVNPLVYVLRLPNYRKTFYLLYCCKRTSR